MFGLKRNFLAILITLSPFACVSALAMPIIATLDFPAESKNIKTENSKNSDEFKKTDVENKSK
ncbi:MULTISPECIES: hypothetical protein [unclassified Acinetobacter]|uniref:hypothetical protein n=1 Tax=unclassified Acinetobacter TaxID=196816 RepID=UPI0015D3EF26|nr:MULTISPECIES: hypothetical protein [unclassified Acinetobacter]QQN40802.1 hypothetical protein JFY49_07945 [Acinetobacter sp. CS-2]